jgi:hypothetical protein
MEACSLWIYKNWVADLDIDVAVTNRIVSAHTLAQSFGSALQ